MTGYKRFVFQINLIFGVLNITYFFLTNSFVNMAIGVFNLWAAAHVWKHKDD